MLDENGDSQQDDSRNDKSKLTFQRMLMVMMMFVIVMMMFVIVMMMFVIVFVLK
jgi:flagellar basal body-associated protein FliL